ncbi:EamA family transporter [soil metagenome]
MNGGSADRATTGAFLAIVLVGGLNGVGVRLSNAELDPFWGAALRFGLASLLMLGLVAIRRVPLPRGRALLGSVLYGLIGFAAAYALAYYALVETPAGLAMVILGLVPLLTLLLAVAHRQEKLRAQALAGSLVALAGVAFIFWERLSAAAVPLLSLLAIVGAAFAIAETGVVVKGFPRAHPLANNAVAMGVGGLVLLALALLAGEALIVPAQAETLAAVAYLVVIGSVALFMLFLYVIERWTASATSYSLLLMPLPAAVGGALLLGEPITLGLILGGALILVGVYLGAFAPSLSAPLAGLFSRRPAAETGTPAETGTATETMVPAGPQAPCP